MNYVLCYYIILIFHAQSLNNSIALSCELLPNLCFDFSIESLDNNSLNFVFSRMHLDIVFFSRFLFRSILRNASKQRLEPNTIDRSIDILKKTVFEKRPVSIMVSAAFAPYRVRPYLIPCSPPHFSSSTPPNCTAFAPYRVRPYLMPCSPPHFSSSTPSSRVRPLIE